MNNEKYDYIVFLLSKKKKKEKKQDHCFVLKSIAIKVFLLL